MARDMPNILVEVTGFLSIKIEQVITAILLEALHTEYVSGVTKERTVKAITFWKKLHNPSTKRRPPMTHPSRLEFRWPYRMSRRSWYTQKGMNKTKACLASTCSNLKW